MSELPFDDGPPSTADTTPAPDVTEGTLTDQGEQADVEEIKVGNRTYRVLFPDLLRPLTEQEYADLRTSIERHGVKMPIHVDDWGGIIDGANRARLSAELGLSNVPFAMHRNLSEHEKRELALTLNLDRRHVTPAERARAKAARVEGIAADRRAGMSQRQLAKKYGISQVQVRHDLDEATERGCSVEPPGGKVKGDDGKERPARRANPPSASPGADEQGDDGKAVVEAQAATTSPVPNVQGTQGAAKPEECPSDKSDRLAWAAKLCGVSRESVVLANKVLKQGTPELIKAVEDGRMDVGKAAELADEPEEVQRERAEEADPEDATVAEIKRLWERLSHPRQHDLLLWLCDPDPGAGPGPRTEWRSAYTGAMRRKTV